VPDLPARQWPTRPTRDNFNDATLAHEWNFLRTPREQFWSLTERPGHLTLQLRPQRLSEQTSPSFVGRRQQHIHFVAQAAVDFVLQVKHECAGMVLVQNNDYHFRFVVTLEDESSVIRLIKRSFGKEEILSQQDISPGQFYLKVEGHEQDYSFYVATVPDEWQPVAENVDGRILSTPVAGGFVGCYIGLYASSNGRSSSNRAHFDWFDYEGLEAGAAENR
jgi:alpha-N-arabinofuranosidase